LSIFSRYKVLLSYPFLSTESEEGDELLPTKEISFLRLEINFFKIIFFLESIPLVRLGVDFETFVKFSSFLTQALY